MNRNDQQFMAQKIRTQYMEKQTTELDTLRSLDKKVKRPAYVFAYVFGSLSALIMGSGMSLIMTDVAQKIGLAHPLRYGLILGIAGMVMAILNVPIYRGILHGRKKKYAAKILEISGNMIK